MNIKLWAWIKIWPIITSTHKFEQVPLVSDRLLLYSNLVSPLGTPCPLLAGAVYRNYPCHTCVPSVFLPLSIPSPHFLLSTLGLIPTFLLYTIVMAGSGALLKWSRATATGNLIFTTCVHPLLKFRTTLGLGQTKERHFEFNWGFSSAHHLWIYNGYKNKNGKSAFLFHENKLCSALVKFRYQQCQSTVSIPSVCSSYQRWDWL